MEKNLDLLHNSCFSTPCQDWERIFLKSSFCEVSGRKILKSLLETSRSYLLSPHSFSRDLSKLPFKCSYQFMHSVLLTPSKQIQVSASLWMSLSLQISEYWFFLKGSYLVDLRKGFDFQFVQAFSCFKMGMTVSKLCMYALKGQISTPFFKCLHFVLIK